MQQSRRRLGYPGFRRRAASQCQADRDCGRARRVRCALARLRARGNQHEGDRAGHDGREGLWDGPLRAAAGDRLCLGHGPLEAGAGGLMISMVRSASGAEQAVRWAKFWPRGERGLNGGNRDGRFGLTPLPEYMAAANASTFLGIQIETAGALAGAAAIAAIPDVDLLFIGPSDLSQVLGVPGDFENSRCLEAIETIARTCAQANKPWGVFSRSGLRGANARPGMPALRPCLRHPHGPRRYPHGQRAVRTVFPGSLNLRSCAAFPWLTAAAAALAAAPPGPRRDSAASCRSWQVPRC